MEYNFVSQAVPSNEAGSNRSSHNLLVFIGHWTDRNTIVVGHQGTDPTQLYGASPPLS